ncbi:MAG: hypothetical protein HYT71_03015 [Candidatus Aenigmarchaeota archaeon]|nr:hypothetical protein [Candidatus Aenigmarchaeota archaeon]
MREPLRGKLHTYSATFSPKPSIGARFANPDIVRRFGYEMDMRWDQLQGYLDMIADRSNCKDSCEIVNGMDLWKHGEGGFLRPERNGLISPEKSYGLVAVYDAIHVISGKGCGFDREMEIIFSVKEYGNVVNDVREIMEAGLPPGIVVGKAWRFHSVDMEEGFSIRTAERF